MKRGGTSKTSNKKKIYQNAGKPKSEMKMTQRDRDEQSRKSESMQYKGGTTKKSTTKSNNFKAGMTREEVQNTPGGRGGYTNAKPKSGSDAKPNPAKPNPSVKKPIKKKASSYADAKKRNPNLDKLIKKRKGLAKGTTEYNMVQNKINRAYGVGPTDRKEMSKMDSKPIPKVALKSTLAVKTPAKSSDTSTKKKVGSKTAPTGGSGMGSINRQKQAIKDLGIEVSKEINFDSKKEPAGKKVNIEKRTNKSQNKRADRRAARKDKRAAIKTLKKTYRKEGGAGLKDAPKGSKGLKKLPTEVRNRMGFKKMGGTTRMGGNMMQKGMGGMEQYKEGGAKDFKPHMMYDPKTGKGIKANTYAKHLELKKKGYDHSKTKKGMGGMKDYRS